MHVRKLMLILPLLIVVFVLLNIPFAVASSTDNTNWQIEKIQEQIASSRNSLDTATAEFERSKSEVQLIDLKIRSNSSKLSHIQNKLDILKRTLNKDTVYNYKIGPYNLLSALVFSCNLNDFIFRLGLYVFSIHRDTKTIDRLTSAKRNLTQDKIKLTEARKENLQRLAIAKQRCDSVERELVSLRDSITDINAKIFKNHRLEEGPAMAILRASRDSFQISRGSARDELVFPVAGSHRYVDTFGEPRPGGRRHEGNDIMSARGTPTVACISGIIGQVTPFNHGLGGISIWLIGDNGDVYYYAHLNGIADGIVKGVRINTGQLIGFVGSTGNAPKSAPHLHFEIHPFGGKATDPFPILQNIERQERGSGTGS